MKTQATKLETNSILLLLMTWFVLGSGAATAQVPVDENGAPIASLADDNYSQEEALAAAAPLTTAELEELVGPVALYPDDLLAIVLPASTYPLEIVQAARFLQLLESDSSLKPVEYWKELRIEFDMKDIEQPVVDLTPSPAVSSFIVYDGAAFPEWQDDFIVGSLKATELYRYVIDGSNHVHSEILLKDLARIRDVESGPDGTIYLLLEHASGGRIVRLVPDR